MSTMAIHPGGRRPEDGPVPAAARIDRSWGSGPGTHGGHLTALRARLDARFGHDRPARALSTHFPAPVDDRPFTLRPLTRADGAALEAVGAGLSADSRYLRFHAAMPRLTQAMRAALLNLDGHDRAALVAEVPDRQGRRPIGIARLARTGVGQAELAIAVVDAWQHRGVGRRLLEALGALAEQLGYRELHGLVLPENDRVVRLLQRVFPGTVVQWDDGVLLVRCPLGRPQVSHDDLLAALVSR